MKSKNVTFLFLALLLALPMLCTAQTSTLSVETALYRLSNNDRAATGLDAPALLVVTLTPAKGWYAYAPVPNNPLVRPPKLSLVIDGQKLPNYLPPGVIKPDPLKPAKNIETYPGATALFVPLPASAQGQTLTATFTAVLCAKDKCVLPNQKLEIVLPSDLGTLAPFAAAGLTKTLQQAISKGVVDKANPGLTAKGETSTKGQTWKFTPRPFAPTLEVSGLISAILLGLVAGLILNFMPCVLPVVSLKISALLSGAGKGDKRERERRFREHNLFFGLGVMLWFLLLAALLGIGDLAWGELFQSAWVVGALAGVLLLLALSLFGLFHLPIIDLKFDQAVTHPKLKALSTGILATLLATPCSGPLLGGVLGWALLRPGAEIAVVFTAIGMGMALPYFLMLAFPGLANFFPKPGPWLAQVEKSVALFLLAAVIYLVSILPDIGAMPWLITAWSLGTGAWLLHLAWSKTNRKATRTIIFTFALALIISGPLWAFSPPDASDPWRDFETQTFKTELGTKLLVLDFTADWCPTCKFLEATVLTHDNLRQWRESFNAEFIRVDLTENHPLAEALLQSLGSQSIPLVAIFPAGETSTSPIVIRDLFTANQLEKALGQARSEQP